MQATQQQQQVIISAKVDCFGYQITLFWDTETNQLHDNGCTQHNLGKIDPYYELAEYEDLIADCGFRIEEDAIVADDNEQATINMMIALIHIIYRAALERFMGRFERFLKSEGSFNN